MNPRKYNRPTVDPVIFSLQAGESKKVWENHDREISQLIVTVRIGEVGVGFGDFTGIQGAPPHLVCTQTGSPHIIPIPTGLYTITISNPGPVSPTVGTVIIMG